MLSYSSPDPTIGTFGAKRPGLRRGAGRLAQGTEACGREEITDTCGPSAAAADTSAVNVADESIDMPLLVPPPSLLLPRQVRLPCVADAAALRRTADDAAARAGAAAGTSAGTIFNNWFTGRSYGGLAEAGDSIPAARCLLTAGT